MATDEKNPLMEGDLEGAAYLCLASAAFTDLGQFPPGSGEIYRRKHHERKRRFEQALLMTKEGVTSLLKIGLSSEDCKWAANKANQAKNPEEWRARFQKAEEMLHEAHR